MDRWKKRVRERSKWKREVEALKVTGRNVGGRCWKVGKVEERWIKRVGRWRRKARRVEKVEKNRWNVENRKKKQISGRGGRE